MNIRGESELVGWAKYLGVALGLSVLLGCEGTGTNTKSLELDPLTGGPAMPRSNPNAPATQPNGVAAIPPQNPLPPLNVPASTTSPAALTGAGVNATLDPNGGLRVNGGLGNQTTPPPATWQSNPIPNPSGATLRMPQPVQDNMSAAPPLAPATFGPITLTAGARGDGYQQLQDALTARGVTSRRLETVGDNEGWKFSCSVPSKQNPNLRLNYESRGQTDLEAIRFVLDQIDREQPRQ